MFVSDLPKFVFDLPMFVSDLPMFVFDLPTIFGVYQKQTNMGRSETDYGVDQKRTMPRRSDCCHSARVSVKHFSWLS